MQKEVLENLIHCGERELNTLQELPYQKKKEPYNKALIDAIERKNKNNQAELNKFEGEL